MSKQTDFHSLLETSFGYTGCNIKLRVERDIRTELILKKIIYNSHEDSFDEYKITYGEYLKTLPEKEQQKKINKVRYNTFLAFHSGKTIMSGLCSLFMRKSYYDFVNAIRKGRDFIEEKLDV
jgi:predicted transcriptional regulator